MEDFDYADEFLDSVFMGAENAKQRDIIEEIIKGCFI